MHQETDGAQYSRVMDACIVQVGGTVYDVKVRVRWGAATYMCLHHLYWPCHFARVLRISPPSAAHFCRCAEGVAASTATARAPSAVCIPAAAARGGGRGAIAACQPFPYQHISVQEDTCWAVRVVTATHNWLTRRYLPLPCCMWWWVMEVLIRGVVTCRVAAPQLPLQLTCSCMCWYSRCHRSDCLGHRERLL